MRTPYHGVFEPFNLRSNRIFFHDWRYVQHGGTRWEDKTGEAWSLWGEEDLPPLHWCETDNPWGICLETQPARKSESFLRCEAPWEGMISGSTVMKHQGRYRLWYEVTPTESISTAEGNQHNVLCYAESDDGFEWSRPNLGAVQFAGDRENNIVYGGPSAPPWGFHGGSVFVDPSAPAETRFKIIHLGSLSENQLDHYKHELDGDIDPFSVTHQAHYAVCGAVSPDGIFWSPISDPLSIQTSDTQNIAYYDSQLGQYVAYLRMWIMGKRSIGRSASNDFHHFPLPDPLIWPGGNVGPADLWYGNAKTVYPGTEDYHLMFPWRWCVAKDHFHVHLAASPDGIIWSFSPDNEVLEPGPRDSFDSGGVTMGCGMIELPDDRVGVAFTGYRIPHKHPRRRPLGELAWALWDRGRLVALKAPEKGQFRTP
ncbi:MAG: hypothetical protein KGZ25_05640, partial [Planctomycetes bacterium]|nr:hypothetical protein [Planctomycetota bacterium]